MNFYPRSPCGERLGLVFYWYSRAQISIHALLAESDFQATTLNRYDIDFYPRSPCGERLVGDVWACRWPDISIHALLAESDLRPAGNQPITPDFYPRSPCGERRFRFLLLRFRFFISIHALLAESDQKTYHQYPKDCKFLSTLSLRRATHRFRSWLIPCNNFYPRSPCGERQCTP